MKKTVTLGLLLCLVMILTACKTGGTLSRYAILEKEENTTARAFVRYQNGMWEEWRAGENTETNGWDTLEIRVYGIAEGETAVLQIESGDGKNEIPFERSENEPYLYVRLSDFPQTNFKLRYVLFS